MYPRIIPPKRSSKISDPLSSRTSPKKSLVFSRKAVAELTTIPIMLPKINLVKK